MKDERYFSISIGLDLLLLAYQFSYTTTTTMTMQEPSLLLARAVIDDTEIRNL
jgi:hypothetical protein